MWTSIRDQRAAAWLDIGPQHGDMTARTVEAVRGLVTAARRRQRGDGAMPPVPLFDVADMIVRAAQATVRAGIKGRMDAAARDAAARVDGLGAALGLEISPEHRKVTDMVNCRPPPPQGATHGNRRAILTP